MCCSSNSQSVHEPFHKMGFVMTIAKQVSEKIDLNVKLNLKSITVCKCNLEFITCLVPLTLTHTHTHTHTHTNTQKYRTYTHTRTHTQTYTHAEIKTHTRAHTHTHTHKYNHTHTHTHPHICRSVGLHSSLDTHT